MRKCRKCKTNIVQEARKYCNECKIKTSICQCGTKFKSKKYQFCKLCRMSQGNDGICCVCEKQKHLYFSTQLCTTCHRTINKYNLNKETLKHLREIQFCGLCGIRFNIHNKPVIDHNHNNGDVRGVLCNQCNVIEGMLRDSDHLTMIFMNYNNWINQSFKISSIEVKMIDNEINF